jgi:hypothetical protein
MKSLILLATITASTILSIVAIGSGADPALACETNANECIKNNGPGQSAFTPPEVSGCHVFEVPADDCARVLSPP